MRDLFLALSNDLAVPGSPAPATTPRRGEYSFIALLAVLVITISSSLGALFAGAHLAAALDPYTQFQSSGFTNKVFNRAAVPLAVGCWALAVGLSVMPLDKDRDRLNNPAPTTERWRSNVSFALAFAPLGCLLRFYISGWLNKHRHAAAFPWGTFAVNFLGTAVLGAAWDLQHAPRALAGGAVVGCQVLQGVEDGFCGCLTTVSTWAVELTSLRGPRRLRDAYVYGSASVGVGLAVLVAIMGGLRWTEGFGEVQCVD
ncbi:Chromosome condensation protein [Microdochium nivale]|nr:Chromosome condensation protein [Microdochium nivale]